MGLPLSKKRSAVHTAPGRLFLYRDVLDELRDAEYTGGVKPRIEPGSPA